MTIFDKAKLKVIGALLLMIISLPGPTNANDRDRCVVQFTEISNRAQTSLVLDIAPAGKRLVAVGTRGHIIYSDDKGSSWHQAVVPVDILLTGVCFPTAKEGWAVGHYGIILHSHDGGATWEKQFDAELANKLALKQLQTRLEQMKAETEKGTQEDREEANRELEELESQMATAKRDIEDGPWKPFFDVWFMDKSNGFAVGAFGMIFGTTDGGVTWEPWMDRMKNTFGYHLNAVTQAGVVLWIAGEFGALYRSINKGGSWNKVDFPYDGSLFGITASKSGDFVVAYGMKGNAFSSSDNGISWQRLNIPIDETLGGGVIFDDNSLAFCSFTGKLIWKKNENEPFMTCNTKCFGCSCLVQFSDDAFLLSGYRGISRIQVMDQ